MDPSTWPTTTVAPIALAVLLAILLLLRRRARAAAAPSPVPAAELPEPTSEDTGAATEPDTATDRAEADADPEPWPALPTGTDPQVGSETAEVRALRMQVRSLEEALDRMTELPAPPAAAAPAPPALAPPAAPERSAGDGDAYRRQVRLTIRALAAQTPEGESPHRALARVAAAIDRLELTDGLSRPALPPVLRRVVPAVLAVEPEPDTLEPQPAVPVPAVEPFDVPDLRRASAAEVVLPVPPPAPAPPKRKGRRLRRQAA